MNIQQFIEMIMRKVAEELKRREQFNLTDPGAEFLLQVYKLHLASLEGSQSATVRIDRLKSVCGEKVIDLAIEFGDPRNIKFQFEALMEEWTIFQIKDRLQSKKVNL
jgi:hypothetical protein